MVLDPSVNIAAKARVRGYPQMIPFPPTSPQAQATLTHRLSVTFLSKESICRVEGQMQGSELGGPLRAALASCVLLGAPHTAASHPFSEQCAPCPSCM